MTAQADDTADLPDFVSIDAPLVPATDFAALMPLRSIASKELGAWIDKLNRCGVIVNRRNSPDLLGQLTQAMRRPMDTVLCGILDSDAGACLNSALAAKFPLELTAGALLVGRLVGAKVTSCITDSRVVSGWLSKLRKTCAAVDVRVEPILNDYPHSDPTLLTWGMTGRRLRPGRLPTEVGVVVLDGAAAVAVGRCALLEESMTRVPLAVRDRVWHDAQFVTAPVGTTIAKIFEVLGVPLEGRALRVGDVLRDFQVKADQAMGHGELVIHCTPPRPNVNPSPCTRCGWCVDWCATKVHPAGVLEAAQSEDLHLAEQSGLEACIECGVCSYVCPSQLPLLEGIRKMQAIAAATNR
ncbi:MAG TPA: 4Fe-4S dicluster domain-containing protein [Tepidisphaeraceae bacterium]|nr:4Fe-4S dicluster domain-containing protein [Tepidisphaeraceae bacterium]